jgi:signal transduction histidine kinase
VQFIIGQMPNLKWMAGTGQPLILPDVRNFAGWFDYPELKWIRSYAGIPLRVKGRLVGFLGFDSATPGFYTPAHAERMQAFADQAAVAIENARLYQEIRRYTDELETRVTDRTRELTEANRRLQELDQLKSKFASDVSHELRTPVTSLKLYTELLEHGKPEKQADYRRVLTEQANGLMQLVEDILNLSRLELGASRIQFKLVDLNALVEAAVVAHQPGADIAGLQLSFTPGADLPAVQGEPNQLAQVITNLITNAINYTPQGTVQVRTFRRDQRVCLEVQDSGPGIDPDDLPHLFDRFYRGAQAVKSKIRGTGLGLAIVKGIIDLHGGTIEVESEVNAGTLFRVSLPGEARDRRIKNNEFAD